MDGSVDTDIRGDAEVHSAYLALESVSPKVQQRQSASRETFLS